MRSVREPRQAAPRPTPDEVVARRAAALTPGRVGKPALVGEHDLVALAADQPAEDLLGAAVVVDVGAVEQVDAGVEAGGEIACASSSSVSPPNDIVPSPSARP